jgi:putative toxin-antitoxin system antitoxin component (TIGR02293 family)
VNTVPQRKAPASQADLIVEAVVSRAAEVLGGRAEAFRWLGAPVRALDFATPISMLETREGSAKVTEVLGQMEHGAW